MVQPKCFRKLYLVYSSYIFLCSLEFVRVSYLSHIECYSCCIIQNNHAMTNRNVWLNLRWKHEDTKTYGKRIQCKHKWSHIMETVWIFFRGGRQLLLLAEHSIRLIFHSQILHVVKVLTYANANYRISFLRYDLLLSALCA